MTLPDARCPLAPRPASAPPSAARAARVAALWAAALSLAAGCARSVGGPPPGQSAAGAAPAADWPAYGRTPLGDRHSPLAEITRANVGRLAVAWRYRTGEAAPAFATRVPTAFEATPVVVDGAMYLGTPLGRVIALDPTTGAERWVYDPGVDRALEFGDFASRGVSVWRDSAAAAGAPCARRVFVATIDARLVALDAASGTPCDGFGERGVVRLAHGLRNPPADPTEYEQTSPPAVVGGLVVVGSAVADNNRTDAASGEVRAFDARTGALRWTWDPVPQDPEDPAHATWSGPGAHRTGGANAWSVIAADPARDLVFVPTGSPSVDYYGAGRRGENRYANSLVALRASTGRLVWHFQTVHHDLWDYDNAAPPALVTLRRGGRDVPVVLQATKTGQLFVLHRETGAPLVPVEERPAPASDVPGEEAWPTQPASGLPPLSPQRMSAADAWGPTPADREACRARLAALRNDGPFTPPSERGSLVLPSNVGGAHWGGLAYDPARGIAVVPTNRIAAVITLIPRGDYEARSARETAGERIGLEYAMMRGTPYVLKRETFLGPSGVPCTPPPFGALVAVNLRSGRIAWQVPLGSGEGLERLGLRPPPGLRGMINLGGPITTTGGLVFIAASPDAYLRAFDVETGAELWRAKLPAGGKATPMTYRGADGRQYVAVAAGGDGELFGRADEVVAFALPRAAPRGGR
jgi:quinoprotein glucose dehydrogenase